MNYIKDKWVYSLIWLVVIAILIWIVAGTGNSETSNELPVNKETYTMATSEVNSTSASEADVKGYYLVRAENDTVKVFWIDGSGEHLHKETTVAYPLMSIEDQEMLKKGIKLETEGELADFLENFDS